MENTSEQTQDIVIKNEIKKWSWAGFLFGPIWGVFNGVYLSLLALLPGAGFVMSIILGIKGNEWAWENKKWESLEVFKETQRKWKVAAIWVCVVVPTLLIILLMARGAILITQSFNTINNF